MISKRLVKVLKTLTASKSLARKDQFGDAVESLFSEFLSELRM